MLVLDIIIISVQFLSLLPCPHASFSFSVVISHLEVLSRTWGRNKRSLRSQKGELRAEKKRIPSVLLRPSSSCNGFYFRREDKCSSPSFFLLATKKSFPLDFPFQRGPSSPLPLFSVSPPSPGERDEGVALSLGLGTLCIARPHRGERKGRK